MHGFLRRMGGLVVLGFGCLVLVQAAQAASFDCAKAGTKVEKLICADAGLSKLDEELNAAYTAALKDEKKASAIKQSQKQWMKERNGCSDVGCVKRAYESRLLILKAFNNNISKHDEYILVEQDLDETTDYLFHIEPDPKVCQLYQENLNYFANQNMPLSCNRPIVPQLKSRIQEVEWEDLKPSDYPELFRQFVLIESSGRDKSPEILKDHAQQVATREYLFRRAKLELTGKTWRYFGESFGLPYHMGSPLEYFTGKFFVIQYGPNDKDVNSPVLPCKPIRGGNYSSLKFYLVNDIMNGVINYLSTSVKGAYAGEKLLLIDGKLYAETISGDATIDLLRVKQGDQIELKLLCSYRFETSCRLPGKETYDPNQPMCKPNLE